ncbi:MAG TPA: heme ABC transporter permease [Pseudolabrys sp.]|jgi:heme exporter protein C
MSLLDPAKPTQFLPLAARALPWLASLTAVAFAVGLVWAFTAPDDFQQGATVQLMFLHVPSAWLITLIWGAMSLAAIATLVWRHPLADIAAKTAAPIGAAFTFLCLVTGSLWERPMLGTYWVWDARQTSVLVLFLMYLGLIALYWTEEYLARVARLAAVLILAGATVLPVIRFSVLWWNTLHQSGTLGRIVAPAIHSSILTPLLLMAFAFGLLFVTLHVAAMRNEIMRQRVRALQLKHVAQGETVDLGAQ